LSQRRNCTYAVVLVTNDDVLESVTKRSRNGALVLFRDVEDVSHYTEHARLRLRPQ